MEFNFRDNLYNVFGYKNFRKIRVYSSPEENNETRVITQLDILNSISTQINKAISGKDYRDLFFIASTGSGKSLLFQLPSIDLHKEGLLTLVITPLKALMKDQVDFLRNKGIDFATFINSDNTYLEREERLRGIKEGKYSLIYASPEFIVKYSKLSNFIGKNRRIGLYVIDEAHCVSVWGKSFRPDYWFIGKRFNKWREEKISNAPILALTATAIYGGDFDSISDIVELLNLKRPEVYLSYIKRENIKITVYKYNPEGNYRDEEKEEFVSGFIRDISQRYNKILLYYPYRSKASLLKEKIESNGIKSEVFVGGMKKEKRNEVYNLFKNGKIKCIVATKAFGMGIDIGDIDCVYHYVITKSLVDYVQEIGRAGRDKGMKAVAITHFHPEDLKFTRTLNNLSGLRQWQLKGIIKKILRLYYEIHKIKKTGWIVVYPETFSNLFKKNDDLETKLEAALLLIEKDYEEKYGYPLISFSIPRYSRVYCAINEENLSKLRKTKYFDCFKKISSRVENERFSYGKEKIRIYDIGDIWEIDLEKLWEKYFKNENLGRLRYKFFAEGEYLLPEIELYPRLEVKASIYKNYEQTKKELVSYLDRIEEALNSFGKRFFKRDELTRELKRRGIKLEHISDSLLRFFKVEGPHSKYANPSQKSYQFINERDDKYRVIRNKIYGFRVFMLRHLKDIFYKSSNYHRFVPLDIEEMLMFLGFLELLNLAMFQISGSNKLAFSINVSNPPEIEQSINSNYRNRLLTLQKLREKNEILLIKKFAEEYKDSKTAWDFIEDYFLGRLDYIEK